MPDIATIDKKEQSSSIPVELIAGPMDGTTVHWNQGKKRAKIPYYQPDPKFFAIYEWEGDGKAIYISG